MKTIVIALVFFVALHEAMIGQKSVDTISFDLKKNVIYMTFGILPNIVGDINYERVLTSSYKSSINIRMAYGYSESLVGTEKMGLLCFNYIYGLKTSHLEFGAGLAYLFDIQRMNFNKNTEFQPVVNFGYRYVQRNGPYVFRIGAGWPECLYISVGFAF